MSPPRADHLLEEHLTRASSLPELLRQRADQTPERVALREKRLGRWQEVTWAQYFDRVRVVALGLAQLGVSAGDRIAIHSENRREWVYSDLGIQLLGAIPFGIYPTNPAAEVEYLLGHSGARVLIAEDQEQLDKALEVRQRCPELAHIVVIDERGLRRYDEIEGLMTWDALVELGEAALADQPEMIDRHLAKRHTDEVMTIVYTSGTTGPPKAAMLTYHNVVAIASTAVEALDYGPDDETLSYLPLNHAAEKYYTVWIPMMVGSVVNFAEGIEAVRQNLVEVQPTLFLGVPRIWQKMQSSIETRMLDASFLKRMNYRLWMRVSRWLAARRMANRGRDDLATRLVGWLGDIFLYRALKAKLGMLDCRWAVSGSAPISRKTLEFFTGLGIPISEGYGLTECVTVALTRKGDTRLGTVGPPVRLAEVKIADDGEILVRAPMVFKGYFRDDAATEASFESGWLLTGDIGEFDDGHLRLTDRKKDIIITAGGKNIAPSEIENALKANRFVKEAVVIGEQRKYLTALVGIEEDVVGDWAQRTGLGYTTFRDLTERPEVVELVQQVVDEVNESFNQVEKLKKIRLLPKELDEDDEEVTATQKVKRRVVEERFADLVDDMYGASS